jgi:transcriptional regulator with XRE-family HTH domain
MTNVFLGEYIKQRRLDLNLTQEQLCEGICEPITLSRLENGKQTPGRSRINAILQRLGLPDDRYFALSSKNELEIEFLKKEILALNVLKNAAECHEKLDQLEKLCEETDFVTKQFVLRNRVLWGRREGIYSPEKQMELLMQAIRLTVPRFDLNHIEDFLYAVDEIKIINQMALVYSGTGQNKKAVDIYYQLLRYIQRHESETAAMNGPYVMILFNYARVLDLSGRYDDSVEYALKGREACLKYGHYQYLPACLEIEAESRYFLGQLEESESLYYQAYYLCKTIGSQTGIASIKEEAYKYHHIEFVH